MEMRFIKPSISDRKKLESEIDSSVNGILIDTSSNPLSYIVELPLLIKEGDGLYEQIFSFPFIIDTGDSNETNFSEKKAWSFACQTINQLIESDKRFIELNKLSKDEPIGLVYR